MIIVSELQSILHFNPRTRVGCDRVGNMVVRAFSDFNPRTRVGCDFASF